MESTYVHQVKLADSAACKELKLIPEHKLDYPSYFGIAIIEKLSKLNFKVKPISIVSKPNKGLIWLHYYDKNKIDDIVEYFCIYFREYNPLVKRGLDRGGKYTIVDLYYKDDKIGLKLKFPGVGEKRIYVGTTSEVQKIFRDYPMEKIQILKRDLEVYLRDAQAEYLFPTQNYYDKNLSRVYEKNISIMQSFPNELIGNYALKYDSQNRAYIKDVNRKKILSKINDFCLPRQTIIEFVFDAEKSVLTARPRFMEESTRVFRSKSYTNSAVYQNRGNLANVVVGEPLVFGDFEESTSDACLRDNSKQSVFRDKLMLEQGECVLTSVRAENALEAAHIKPFSTCCIEGDTESMYDQFNGFMLRKDLHSLYDYGLISFSLDGDKAYLKISSSISTRDKSILGIREGLEARLNVNKREPFIQWHFANKFKP